MKVIDINSDIVSLHSVVVGESGKYMLSRYSRCNLKKEAENKPKHSPEQNDATA
jgi:hypothetical protein